MGNASGASWADSFTLPYEIFDTKKWEMLQALPKIRFYFFLKSLLKHNGKQPWSFFGEIHQVSLLNPY